MRVRKSVPEGYKTGGYSAFGLFADNAPVIAKKAPVQSARADAGRSAGQVRGGKKELTPFCGMLKVGGLAQQDSWYAGYGDGEDDDEEELDVDDVPFLSSQGSTVSNVSVDGGVLKRSYQEDEDEDEEHDQVRILGGGLVGRPLAMPRSKKAVLPYSGGPSRVDDFEEAEFLDFTGVEIEMGDA